MKTGRYVATVRVANSGTVKFCVDGISKANAKVNLAKDPEFLKWLARVGEDKVIEVLVMASAVKLKQGMIEGRVLLAKE